MRFDLTLTDAPDPDARAAILRHLKAFNTQQAGARDDRPLAILLTNPETGEILGGLWGRTALDWLFVELLFVPEALRGAGTGRDMMRRAEAEARARGCHGVWLDTFSFQARGFYEKLGYTVFGTIDDFPVGHRRFFLKKTL